jgi:hypothetical protein
MAMNSDTLHPGNTPGGRMESQLSLAYSGPSVDSGQMDVYQAAANMIAFSDFVLAAAKAAYGENVRAKAEVAGFGRGSFVTDIVFNVVGPAATLWAAQGPEFYLDILKDAIALWKLLKGEPPKSIQTTDNGQHALVVTNNGQIVQVRTETLNLVFNDKATESVQQFVREALSRPGVDSMRIDTPKVPIAKISQEEAGYFVPVRPADKVTDVKIRMHLIIEAPVFKEGNKWRFSDGQTSFYAEILDKEFRARVDAGERFGKGDVLEVDLQLVQDRFGAKISTERVILKVIDHRAGFEQVRLDFPPR